MIPYVQQPDDAELYLDAAELEERRLRRAERFDTWTVPALRAAGLQLVLLLVVLHGWLVPEDPQWRAVLVFAVLLEGYCAVSWLVLRALYGRAPTALPLLFLGLDVVLFAGAVYITGASRSWLFPLVFMHVADQTATTFRRVLGFAHLAVFCYVAMVLIAAARSSVPPDWSTEATKVALLYAMGLYTASTARTAERLRDRLVHTVRLSRDLVARLEESSLETQRALRLSEVANRSKNQFLANMSHELRTPLNSVIGFADVLLKNRKAHFDDAEMSFLRRIRDNGAHLLAIIGDILDLSRIEAGRMDVEMADVDLRQLVGEVMASLAGTPHAAGLEMRADVPLVLERVRTDRDRLRQVLLNLVGNALKFTAEGTVSVRVVADDRHRPRAIEVTDTGIGIPADRLGMIFRPFEQADNTTSRKYGGTGLGLSISHSLCELMGCRLEAESEPGRGSTFRVLLPGAMN